MRTSTENGNGNAESAYTPQFAAETKGHNYKRWVKVGAGVIGATLLVGGGLKAFDITEREQRKADLFAAEALQVRHYLDAQESGRAMPTTGEVHFYGEGTNIRENWGRFNEKSFLGISWLGLLSVPGNVERTVDSGQTLVVVDGIEFTNDDSKEWEDFRMGTTSESGYTNVAEFTDEMFTVHTEDLSDQRKLTICSITNPDAADSLASITSEWSMVNGMGDPRVATGYIMSNEQVQAFKYSLGCDGGEDLNN